jgi:hypothetical protein
VSRESSVEVRSSGENRRKGKDKRRKGTARFWPVGRHERLSDIRVAVLRPADWVPVAPAISLPLRSVHFVSELVKYLAAEVRGSPGSRLQHVHRKEN